MQQKILFIPVDDRPCTLKIPARLAAIAGAVLISPPREMLGKYNTPGNCDEILKWLKTVKGHFDASIIAVDMPLYGGLVASRTEKDNIEIIKKRIQILTKIIKTRKNDFGKIYLFNALLRTAPTYTDEKLVPVIQKLIDYSSESCKAEKGDAKAGKTAERIRCEIPSEMLSRYMEVRNRNHMINLEMLEIIKNRNADYLLIGIDDSKTSGFNVLEREKIEKEIESLNIEDLVIIAPGTDESTGLLIVRALTELKGLNPSIYPVYSNPGMKSSIPRYEDRSFEEIVKLHIKACNCIFSDSGENADIVLFLHLPEGEQKEAASQKISFRSGANLEKTVSSINNFFKNKKIAIADVFYSNGADIKFVKKLANSIDISKLQAYAAWNTAGNTIGTSLSHAACAFIGEKCALNENDLKIRLKEHLELLIERFADDWLYQSVVRQKAGAEAMLRNVSTFHLDENSEKFKQIVRKELGNKIEKIFKEHFFNKKIDAGHGFSFIINGLFKSNIDLPWDRLFEVDAEIEISLISAQNLSLK